MYVLSPEERQERFQYYLKVAETICSPAFRNHPVICQVNQEQDNILAYAEKKEVFLDNLITPEVEQNWQSRNEKVLEHDFGLSSTFPNKLGAAIHSG